ncbi:MAG: STAS domain-containing protein [Phycisphaerales bacterium]|nr:MAG: STAS domain-containing protein [Phycisphaerales bacterium]
MITLAPSEMLDAHYIEKLGDEIYHHVKTIEAPRLVIDLENVRHMSSAALGMLIALKKVTDRQGGRICLANVRDDLVQVFKLTKLHKVLKIHGSIDKAVKSLT